MAIRFIDLFAGIGGFRLALESVGCECVFSSETDKFARKTYAENFGEEPRGDITKIRNSDIPRFDILTAGFPCQPFSAASNERKGFEDKRGQLFFEIARIIRYHEPKAFILENVKGLLGHDGGNTFRTIMHILKDCLRYQVEYKVLNARNFGVPQNRERVFIAGFRKDIDCTFEFPAGNRERKCIRDIMENEAVPPCHYITEQAYSTLKKHKARHDERGTGLGFRVCDIGGVSHTLMTARFARKDNLIADKRITRLETLVYGRNRDCIRYYTLRECARLQGFPDTFKIPVSRECGYRQFGNAVAVPVVTAVAERVCEILNRRTAALHDSEREFSRSKTKFPNLALMKLSAYHKARGDFVTWWKPDKHYDVVYSSKVFDFTPTEPRLPKSTIRGGTGYSVTAKLPQAVDDTPPDYTLYPECDYAVGYLTRGCVRNCPWCVVHEKEGDIKPYRHWRDVVRADTNKLILMDNNILACDYGVSQLAELADTDYRVDCNQGLDARFVTESVAEILSRVKWIRFIRFSCDESAQLNAVRNAAELLRRYGVKPYRLFFYTMVTSDIEQAAAIVDELKKLGSITIYAQPEMRTGLTITKAQKEFAKRYVYKGIYRKETWREYCEKRGLSYA